MLEEELKESKEGGEDGKGSDEAYNLPSLAKRLEYHLYTESKTLQEYDDRYDLKINRFVLSRSILPDDGRPIARRCGNDWRLRSSVCRQKMHDH